MAQVNVRKRGNLYQYRFEIAPQGGTRKYINKSGFRTKQEAFKRGEIDQDDVTLAYETLKELEDKYVDDLDNLKKLTNYFGKIFGREINCFKN